MAGPDASEREPEPQAADPRRATWNGAMVAELRAMQEPGDPDLVAELLETFRRDAGVVLATVRDDASRRDFVRVREAAHRVRGGALNLGADRFARAAGELEQAAVRADAAALDALVADVFAERDRFFARSDAR